MSDQKIVLRLEIIFDGDGITSSKDVKEFLADWVQQVGKSKPHIKQVNGKAIEHSPNGKQKELIAVANYKDGEINAMTTTENYCATHGISKEELAKFCEQHNMKLKEE